jgi:hypothetical protein
MPRARKRGGSSRLSRRQARGGKGSGGGDRPLKMVARSGQWTSLKPTADSPTTVFAGTGTGVAGAYAQATAGIGQGTPSQSGQWLQGVLVVPLCGTDPPTGKANAATDMNPLARTARQANVAARVRKRVTPHYRSAAAALPIGPKSRSRDAADHRHGNTLHHLAACAGRNAVLDLHAVIACREPMHSGEARRAASPSTSAECTNRSAQSALVGAA